MQKPTATKISFEKKNKAFINISLKYQNLCNIRITMKI